MNKEQFIEVLSGFIAPRMVEALAEQAEGKGYFEENTSTQDCPIDIARMAEAARKNNREE